MLVVDAGLHQMCLLVYLWATKTYDNVQDGRIKEPWEEDKKNVDQTSRSKLDGIHCRANFDHANISLCEEIERIAT